MKFPSQPVLPFLASALHLTLLFHIISWLVQGYDTVRSVLCSVYLHTHTHICKHTRFFSCIILYVCVIVHVWVCVCRWSEPYLQVPLWTTTTNNFASHWNTRKQILKRNDKREETREKERLSLSGLNEELYIDAAETEPLLYLTTYTQYLVTRWHPSTGSFAPPPAH